MSKIRELYKADMANERPSQELIKKTMTAMATGHKSRTKSSRRYKWGMIIPIAVLFTLMMITTVTAVSVIVSKFMKPSEIIAVKEGYDNLSAAFESEVAFNINESIATEDYIFTLLAIVSGDDLKNEFYYREGVQDDRTYVLYAIENADGTPFPDDWGKILPDMRLYASPFVKGLKPWNFNVAVLSGGGPGFIKDGIIYKLIECDNFEIFADRGLYFIICGGGAIYDQDAIIYDEETGEIKANPDYDGPCAVFNLPIDKSLGDYEKAEEYLHSVDYYWMPPETTEKNIEDSPIYIEYISEPEEKNDRNINTVIANDSFLDGPQKEDYIVYIQKIDDNVPYTPTGEKYSGDIPTNWNEWNVLSDEDQEKLISSINWDRADNRYLDRQELLADENGVITYSYTLNFKYDTKYDLYISVPLNELFENNQTAQSKILSREIAGSDNYLNAHAIKISINKSGKITGSVILIQGSQYPADGFIPSTWEEYIEMDRFEQFNLRFGLDWNKAALLEESLKEVTIDAKGMLNYSWKIYDENGEIKDGGDTSERFIDIFEDIEIAQIRMSGGCGIGPDENGNIKFSSTQYSMDENGKITAVVLEMTYPDIALKRLFED